MTDPLTSVRAKLARAKKHREDLDAEIARTIEDYATPAALYFDFKQSQGWAKYIWLGDPLPLRFEEWGAILGDYLYNLRSALDHLAEQLILVSGGVADDPNTAFPIFKSERTFKQRSGLATADMTDDIRADLERLQPYKVTPQEPRANVLWRLQELCNIDKHRRPNIAEFVAFDAGVDLQGTDFVWKSVPVRFPVRLERNAVLAHYRFPKNTRPVAKPPHRKVNMQFHFDFDVALKDVVGFWKPTGKVTKQVRLRDVLNGTVGYIEAVVLPTFEKYF